MDVVDLWDSGVLYISLLPWDRIFKPGGNHYTTFCSTSGYFTFCALSYTITPKPRRTHLDLLCYLLLIFVSLHHSNSYLLYVDWLLYATITLLFQLRTFIPSQYQWAICANTNIEKGIWKVYYIWLTKCEQFSPKMICHCIRHSSLVFLTIPDVDCLQRSHLSTSKAIISTYDICITSGIPCGYTCRIPSSSIT